MKKSFEEKCNELIKYEEETLQDLKIYIEPMNKSLKEKGLKCAIIFNFYDSDISGIYKFTHTRPKLKRKYNCYMDFIVCKQEDDIYNDDIECVFLPSRISYISHFMFKKHIKFYRQTDLNLKDIIKKIYNDIIEKGYEYARENNTYYINLINKSKIIIKEIK